MEQVIYTTCALDCPDGCGILAHVKDGRVIRLEGHPDHEMTQRFLCPKVYKYPERVYSAERILHPLRRVDGRWEQIGWDEALDTIADKMRYVTGAYGSLSIMGYQRTGSWGATKILSRRFWNLLGGVTLPSGSL